MRNCNILDVEIPLADPEEVIRQYEPYIRKLARRYESVLSRSGAVGADDLHQVGRLAVLDAQKRYDPTVGASFLTFITNPIRKAMRITLGIKNNGEAPAALASLDDPLPGIEGLTLADRVPDSTPTAEERTVAQDGQQEIVDTVRGAVDRLKSAKHREVISRIWLDGQDKQTAAEEMGISLASLRNLDLKARYKLRRDRKLRMLAFPLYHVGVDTFHRTSLSATELAVLWREQHYDAVFGDGAFAGTRDQDEERYE